MKKSLGYIILLGLIAIGIIGIILTIKQPLGLKFDFYVYLFLIGIIGILSITAIDWFKKSVVKKVFASLFTLFALVILLITFIVLVDFRILMPAVSSKPLTHEMWLEDFEYLSTTLQDHPAINDSIQSILNAYKKDVISKSSISDCDALTTSMKMISLFKDGHSNMMPFQFYMKTRFLPIQVYDFEDGIYVTESSQKDLNGAKIISINEVPIDTIVKNIYQLIGSDNSYFSKYQAALYIPNMTILECLEYASSPKEAILEMLIDQNVEKVHLKSVPAIKWLMWSLSPNNAKPPVGHNIRNADNYIEVINDTLLWMTFNKTGPEQILTDIGNKIINKMYGKNIRHMVIDMRNNTGGDNSTYNALVKSLSKSSIGITLLTSRKTFSAGINFISELKLERDFIIIGEPTGAGHNHYGNPENFFLPNSGLMFTLSKKEWKFIPNDDDKWILPDIRITYKSEDFFQHKDPWSKAFEEDK